uniref:Homeodomain-like n=2 Tax=Medicago truncatula TaxID=3880 RepID=A2Q556_MEDTR|nr:Homeodomain-like [Medicago truncatula]
MSLDIDLEAQPDPNDEGGAAISEDEHDGDDEFDEEPSKGKRSFLSNTEREAVAQILLSESHNGKLKRGTVVRLASTYSVSKDVIYRVLKQIRQSGDARHKKTKNCGRKRIEVDMEKMCDVPLDKRSTYRALGHAIGVNKNILLRNKKEGILRRISSPLKPHLNENNMKSCLRFCLSNLEDSSIPQEPKFKSMYNVVHIDEKWFEMTKKNKKYYLLSDEADPHRTCKNKNYITKVMVLAAVARPRFDSDGNETFSGKIGMFPLVHEVPAIRSSVNRAA